MFILIIFIELNLDLKINISYHFLIFFLASATFLPKNNQR